MEAHGSNNKIVLSCLNIIPNDMITTSTFKKTTTVTVWSKIPVSGILEEKNMNANEVASSTSTGRSTLTGMSQSASTGTSAIASTTNTLATSTTATSSLQKGGLQTILNSGNGGSSMSTLTLALAIGIPAGIVLFALIVILCWYRNNCKNREKKKSNAEAVGSWKRNPFNSYSEDEFAEGTDKEKSFGSCSYNWENETKVQNPTNRNTSGTSICEQKLENQGTMSSGSLSTFELGKNLSEEKLGEAKREKMDGMYENYRIRHMAPIQRLLIKTPGSALKKFFDRQSQHARIETANSTPIEDKLPKPKQAALRSLRLVNRLHELRESSGSYSSDKENRDPSDVHPLPIRQYPNSRIVGDVPKNVYRKAHENGIR